MIDSGTFLERVWLAVSPDGRELAVSIQVGAPVLQPTGEWTSIVSFVGLAKNGEGIHGMDSWQAVAVGMRHAAMRLKHFESLGWRFFWDDIDRDVASPSELWKGI
jgi:hypothetical protein